MDRHRRTGQRDKGDGVRQRAIKSDVAAGAVLIASLPISADPSAVPKGTLPMPLACGSEPN
jgi:hypothetical protein